MSFLKKAPLVFWSDSRWPSEPQRATHCHLPNTASHLSFLTWVLEARPGPHAGMANTLVLELPSPVGGVGDSFLRSTSWMQTLRLRWTSSYPQKQERAGYGDDGLSKGRADVVNAVARLSPHRPCADLSFLPFVPSLPNGRGFSPDRTPVDRGMTLFRSARLPLQALCTPVPLLLLLLQVSGSHRGNRGNWLLPTCLQAQVATAWKVLEYGSNETSLGTASRSYYPLLNGCLGNRPQLLCYTITVCDGGPYLWIWNGPSLYPACRCPVPVFS